MNSYLACVLFYVFPRVLGYLVNGADTDITEQTKQKERNYSLNDVLSFPITKTHFGLFEEARLVKHRLFVIKDDFFLVAMGSLILLMQAGFAFLEAGSIRAKNATNILIKNFTDLCAGMLPFPSFLDYPLFNDILISDLSHDDHEVCSD